VGGSSSNPKALRAGLPLQKTPYTTPPGRSHDTKIPPFRGPQTPCPGRERGHVRLARRVVFPSATATKASCSDLKDGLGRQATDTTRWARAAPTSPPPPLSPTSTARAARWWFLSLSLLRPNLQREGGGATHTEGGPAPALVPVRGRSVVSPAIPQP